MNFKNILFFLCFALVVVSFNVYAVDSSICNSGVSVVVHDNGSLKSCDLKDDYDANNIRCSIKVVLAFITTATWNLVSSLRKRPLARISAINLV
jgi:hypothetical protein